MPSDPGQPFGYTLHVPNKMAQEGMRKLPLAVQSCVDHAFAVHGRHVFNLHFWHSKMNQWGPEWHKAQCQRMSVVSDLIILKLCSQLPGTAIVIDVLVNV